MSAIIRKVHPQNSARFVLAALFSAGGHARLQTSELGEVGLLIGPPSVANKLKAEIEAHRPRIICLLLANTCPLDGAEMAAEGRSRLEAGKWVTRRVCAKCGNGRTDEMPDFPVYDKDGKEI